MNIDDISNPFIEKSDIANHKKRIAAIDQKKEEIQSQYKDCTTFSQDLIAKGQKREAYFEEKMNERFQIIDKQKSDVVMQRKQK